MTDDTPSAAALRTAVALLNAARDAEPMPYRANELEEVADFLSDLLDPSED